MEYRAVRAYLHLAFPLALCLGSCASTQFIAAETNSREVRDVVLLSPSAFVSYIEKGNKSFPSDSLSAVTDSLLRLVVPHSRILPVDSTLLELDPVTRSATADALARLVQQAAKQRNKGSLPAPPLLDSLIEASGHRYGMALVGTGFGRRKGNYAGQSAKAVGVGILTLGLYAPIPIKSNLTLFTAIVDAETDQVVYVNRTLPVEKDPTDEGVVRVELEKLYEGFWYPRARRRR